MDTQLNPADDAAPTSQKPALDRPTRTGDEDAEEFVVALSERLTAAQPGECVFHYVDRMLIEFGCDTTLRWARHWRDERLPRATGLERRLGARGGYCDCEVFLNGWTVRDDLLVRDPESGLLDWPAQRPACAGVGARPAQPCGTWVPQRRRHGTGRQHHRTAPARIHDDLLGRSDQELAAG